MNREELEKIDFETYHYRKFRKGMLEHKEDWDYYVIKPLWEMMDEVADLYNYATLVAEKYPTLGKKHMKICKELWTDIKSHIIIFKQ